MTANETAYDMHKAGYSLKDIASHLNKEGYERPFGARRDETAVQSAVVEHVEELKQGKITKWRPDDGDKHGMQSRGEPTIANVKMVKEAVSEYERYGRTCPRRWSAKWGDICHLYTASEEAKSIADKYMAYKGECEAALDKIRKPVSEKYDPATLRGTNSIYVY